MSSTAFKTTIPLLLIPAVLMMIWFRHGLITGGGEEGVLFYNINKTLQLSTSTWIDYMTGITNLNWLQRAPVIYLATLFEKTGIPLFIFQSILFYILIVVGLYSVYYLTLYLLDQHKAKTKIALISAGFYLFNPFSFSQIWGRSLYTQYFAFSLLPLTLLLFYVGIKKKKYIFGFLIALTSSLLAWAYGFLTYIIVYWFLLFLYLIFAVLTSKDRRSELFFDIKFFFLTIILWFIFNCWWFIPMLSSFTNVYTVGITGSEDNLGTLRGVSKSYPLDIIVRLLHKGYFFDASAYSPVYSSVFFQLISMIPFLFVLVGLIKLLREKELVNIRFFALLLILGLVVSLGANFPTGELFVFIFKRVSVLQAFRNPFEKFGLVYALGYSVIFAYGLVGFWERWKFKKLVISLVLILTCGVYAWPMWTGRVIAGIDKKIGLDIPTYYKDLQNWLRTQGEDYRVLFTPIWGGDGAFYKWGSGARYQGIDTMISMLDQPPISNSSRAPFFGDFLTSIRKNMERENVVPAISLLRAKYLIDRKDAIMITDREKDHYNFLTSSIFPPQGIEQNLKIICPNMEADSSSNNIAWIVCQISQDKSNLSEIKYLHLKVKTNIPAHLEVALRDAKGIRIRWDGRSDFDYSTDSNDWQYVTIPLSTPTENNSEIDFSGITVLEVLAHSKDNDLASVGKINVAEVKLDPGKETKINEFNKVAQFANLSIFEPINFNPPPEFGSLLQIEEVKDFPGLFDQTNKKRNLINTTGFLLISQNPNKDLDKLDGKVSLQVSDRQKISDTRYWMRVRGDSGYGLIILSKRFDPGWKLIPGVDSEAIKGGIFKDLQILQKQRLSENDHYVINGYANLWKIGEENNNYAIVFMPQVLADISLRISVLSILLATTFLILKRLSKGFFHG